MAVHSKVLHLAAAGLLGLRIRVPAGAWMFVYCAGLRPVRCTDHSSREVLPNVCVCVCVYARARACLPERTHSVIG